MGGGGGGVQAEMLQFSKLGSISRARICTGFKEPRNRFHQAKLVNRLTESIPRNRFLSSIKFTNTGSALCSPLAEGHTGSSAVLTAMPMSTISTASSGGVCHWGIYSMYLETHHGLPPHKGWEVAALQRQNAENLKQIFPEKEYRGLSTKGETLFYV
jgi:hypothetical protein